MKTQQRPVLAYAHYISDDLKTGKKGSVTLDFFSAPLMKKPITWDDVTPWQSMQPPPIKNPTIQWAKERLPATGAEFSVSPELNAKIAIVGPQADICSLKVDAVVNAANSELIGGSGVDGAIHRAAGPDLRRDLRGQYCPVGEVVVTRGHNLHAKHIFHTVAPIGHGDVDMRSCYWNCLETLAQLNLRTIAFCCLGTGVFSFPNTRAAWIALHTVRTWLQTAPAATHITGIVFVIFQPLDYEAYLHLLPQFFPKESKEQPESQPTSDEDSTAAPLSPLPEADPPTSLQAETTDS